LTLIRFYKPFGVLSQFRDPDRPTLADYLSVPGVYLSVPGVYPAGRLDRDSEGLLLLTDDGALQARIAEPRHKQPKVYWVQVEARPARDETAALARRLAAGVELRDGLARADAVRCITDPQLPPRHPPVTAHRAARGSWLEVVLSSGRNRQVRRMLAAVGLPVLRLHRARIGPVDLQGLSPGEYAEMPVPGIWQQALGQPLRPRASRRRRPSR